jgi:hypothetical protein
MDQLLLHVEKSPLRCVGHSTVPEVGRQFARLHRLYAPGFPHALAGTPCEVDLTTTAGSASPPAGCLLQPGPAIVPVIWHWAGTDGTTASHATLLLIPPRGKTMVFYDPAGHEDPLPLGDWLVSRLRRAGRPARVMRGPWLQELLEEADDAPAAGVCSALCLLVAAEVWRTWAFGTPDRVVSALARGLRSALNHGGVPRERVRRVLLRWQRAVQRTPPTSPALANLCGLLVARGAGGRWCAVHGCQRPMAPCGLTGGRWALCWRHLRARCG